MSDSTRFAFLVGGLAFAIQLSAAPELSVVRRNVGVTGTPQQLSAPLDTNHNGRRELLIAGRAHLSLVEEAAGPRGYREIARLEQPHWQSFVSATLVHLPGTEPALLVQWSDRVDLLDAATLRPKATRSTNRFSGIGLGDVDGDGLAEIVVSYSWMLELLDPETLASRGSLQLSLGRIAVADIVGDARAEIISDTGSAYSLTHSGGSWASGEVWNAGITGKWHPYVVDLNGSKALVLHDEFGFSAKLATFQPTPALRPLVPADGPMFVPIIADANGDGREDLLVATGSVVRALDIASGATLWRRDTSYEPPYIGAVYSPVVADLDGDGVIEMVWSSESGYYGGVVAISAPLAGAPRWRSDGMQTSAADWTRIRRADGSTSHVYLSQPTRAAPNLGTLGFLDAVTYADQAGSVLAWLPGYSGYGQTTQWQRGLTAVPRPGQADAVVVVGAELPVFGGAPLARWLWTFDDSGAFVSARTFSSSIEPFRIAAAQVLDRPERQLVVAGWLPGMETSTARVEVIDDATGNLLWQSAPLPSYNGGMLSRLEIADLDADGRPEVVVAYGTNVAVLTPAAGSAVVAGYSAETFSLLGRGAGRKPLLATLRDTGVAVYEGMSTVPDKTFVLPSRGSGIALFARAPDDELMFATGSNYGALTVRRYADGGIVATSDALMAFGDLTAMDVDGDHRIDIVDSASLTTWRLDNDYVFRNGLD